MSSEFQHLVSLASAYLQEADLSPLTKAHDFIVERHAGKLSASGDPYIRHLVVVASTLAGMKLDMSTIIAGLLHGTLKEGAATREELEKEFGADVARIVDGATRITNVRYNSQLTHEAENIRKLLLAISSDIRVLLVKLADRLQDMLTLDYAPEEERRAKAKEVMDLYVPLASRIGIEWMKRELEDLAFKYLLPVEYADLNTRLEGSFVERQAYVDQVLGVIHGQLRENHVEPVRVLGRPKHMYSIYKKLMAQKIPLEQVYDKVAFRIIVREKEECYRALGLIHDKWTPVPGRFKDFISSPKANNYQSLHTTVIGPLGQFIEVQIRTEEMDRVAQEGVAAHWAYKEGQKITGADARLFRELKKLVVSLQEVEDPGEFMDSLRGELFVAPDVYVLTPTGEVRALPWGSTPIDFAYAIHSVVGDTCVGARVNGHIVQLKYALQSGDIVEVLTQKNQHPRRAWLQIVKTSRARTRIRQYLRQEERRHSLKLGREICERELKKYEMNLSTLLKGGHLRLMLKTLHCQSLDDMLIRVGSGVLTVPALVRALYPEEYREAEEKRRKEEIIERAQRAAEEVRSGGGRRDVIDLDGVDGMLVKVSQCCRPVPGDAIIGFITTGSGLSIHKADCPNLLNSNPARWLDVVWSSAPHGNYRASLLIQAENGKDLLAEVSNAINVDEARIAELNVRTTLDGMAALELLLEVRGLKHLQQVQRRLLNLPGVIEVVRR